MIQLNINTTAIVKFTAKLEKLHRSALPSAIRGTLNNAAFDVKQNTMPKSVAQNFKRREPRFFSANSKYEKAGGFDVNKMKATFYFFENKLANQGTNYAVQDLEQQEYGGEIRHRNYVGLEGARKGKSKLGNIRPNARLSTIKKIINGKEAKGKNWAQRAIKSSVFAGVDGFVLMPGRKGSVLWRIDSLKRKGGNIVFKKIKLYSFNKNRVVKPHATNFMKEASSETQKKIDAIYIKEAQRQIEKYYK